MGEMEMWQRCLWALRFEVAPAVVNDVEKHVTEKIDALAAQLAERDARIGALEEANEQHQDVFVEAVNVVLAWERLGKCEDEFTDYLHDGACSECADGLDGAILRLKGTMSPDATPAPLAAADRDELEWIRAAAEDYCREGNHQDDTAYWVAVFRAHLDKLRAARGEAGDE